MLKPDDVFKQLKEDLQRNNLLEAEEKPTTTKKLTGKRVTPFDGVPALGTLYRSEHKQYGLLQWRLRRGEEEDSTLVATSQWPGQISGVRMGWGATGYLIPLKVEYPGHYVFDVCGAHRAQALEYADLLLSLVCSSSSLSVMPGTLTQHVQAIGSLGTLARFSFLVEEFARAHTQTSSWHSRGSSAVVNPPYVSQRMYDELAEQGASAKTELAKSAKKIYALEGKVAKTKLELADLKRLVKDLQSDPDAATKAQIQELTAEVHTLKKERFDLLRAARASLYEELLQTTGFTYEQLMTFRKPVAVGTLEID